MPGPRPGPSRTEVYPANLGPEGTYSFAAAPRAQIAQPRRRYREGQPMATNGEASHRVPHTNLMYNKRVIRGNTYAQVDLRDHPDPFELQRQQELRKKALARRRARDNRPMTPDAVEGRIHETVQTDTYLHELSQQISESDVGCQTDDFIDRPPTPLYVPRKTGVDVATQIYKGDLFDFDIESKPLVSVLVGKTMEQALLEVMEEEELASLRQRQREFEEMRQAELLEAQRLEEEERRHRVEKENRLKQMKEAELIRKQMLAKVASHAFAKNYATDFMPGVLGKMQVSGYFKDLEQEDVDSSFFPSLIEGVYSTVAGKTVAQDIVNTLVYEVVNTLFDGFKHAVFRQAEREDQIAQVDQAAIEDAADLGVNPYEGERIFGTADASGAAPASSGMEMATPETIAPENAPTTVVDFAVDNDDDADVEAADDHGVFDSGN